MSPLTLADDLRLFVRLRAAGRCEYCLLPDMVAFYAFEIDHVIARKHGGETVAENLALSCWRCNRHKGTDIASFDPQTGELSLLFNPRTQRWIDHFSYQGAELVTTTAQGRTTARLLQLHAPRRIVERQRFITMGYAYEPEGE